jgi:hypothetical protein
MMIIAFWNSDAVLFVKQVLLGHYFHHDHDHHHHHKHQGLGPLARSVSRVTAALASVSLVSQLFSFLVDCSGMILKGFGVVAFIAPSDIKVHCFTYQKALTFVVITMRIYRIYKYRIYKGLIV